MRESGQAPGLVPGSEGFDYSKREGPKPADALARPLLPSRPEARKGFSRVLHREDFREDALDYLRLVRINDPAAILDLYPHEPSGAMRQRLMIALALSESPHLLHADAAPS